VCCIRVYSTGAPAGGSSLETAFLCVLYESILHMAAALIPLEIAHKTTKLWSLICRISGTVQLPVQYNIKTGFRVPKEGTAPKRKLNINLFQCFKLLMEIEITHQWKGSLRNRNLGDSPPTGLSPSLSDSSPLYF